MSREVKRVPRSFDWPLKQVWHGYLMPDDLDEVPCPTCGPAAQVLDPFETYGDGYTPAAREIANTYYPHQVEALGLPRSVAWHDKLTEDEVDMLVSERCIAPECWDRIDHDKPYEIDTHGFPIAFTWVRNSTPAPTVEQVNAFQRGGSVDAASSRNRMLLIRHRCHRLGITIDCPTCGGDGTIEAYPGQRADAENWARTDPPSGTGWQLWETTSEGSPVSPVFATGEELARWLTTKEGGKAVGFGHYCEPLTISEARGFVNAGWAPAMIGNPGGIHDGAAYVGSEAALNHLDPS